MGEKKEQEKSRKNSKKLFQPGGPGGPGRGKKKPPEPITLEEIEIRLQNDLRSKDPKVRHNATKLLLALRKAQANESDPDKITVLDSRLQQLFAIHTEILAGDPGVRGVDETGEAGGSGLKADCPVFVFL